MKRKELFDFWSIGLLMLAFRFAIGKSKNAVAAYDRPAQPPRLHVLLRLRAFIIIISSVIRDIESVWYNAWQCSDIS